MKKVILTCSLKGGTGKSTISSYLAKYLSDRGHNVVLIDADIDSPNISEIFKIDKKLRMTADYIEIAHFKNLDVFSAGYYTDKAISMSGDSYTQFLIDVLTYGKFNVDVNNSIIIIDCPAGASDTFKFMVKVFAKYIAGAIVVGVPNNYKDVDRMLSILENYAIPTLCVVKNFSYIICPKCEEIIDMDNENFDKVCSDHNIDKIFELPYSKEIIEGLQNIVNLTEYPKEMYQFLTEIEPIILNAKVEGDSILKKLFSKIDKKIKKELVKSIVETIKKSNEVLSEHIKKLEDEGFGNKVIELIITNEGEELLITYFKIKDGKIYIVKNPKKVQYRVVIEYKGLEKVLLSELFGKGNYTLEDAFLMDEIKIIGTGGTNRALGFFREFYEMLKDELIPALKPIYKSWLGIKGDKK